MLLNGKMDELLYDLKVIETEGLPFATLKARPHQARRPGCG
jgi:hypothetical protein